MKCSRLKYYSSAPGGTLFKRLRENVRVLRLVEAPNAITSKWLNVKHFAILFLACALGPLAWSAEPPHSEKLRRSHARSSFPFHAIGVYWRDPSITGIRARASADGRNWTAWVPSHGEIVEGDRMGSGLIYFGKGYRYFEVEGVPDPEVLVIDPGPSPASVKPVAAADVPAPAIVTREQWGCTPQSCPARDAPLYTTVTHLIVHHTDGGNTAPDWGAVVRSIWVLHVRGNGWNDIGYNYLIDPNGLLYEGRAGGDGVLGAHFSGVNSGTMGVAMLGTYIDAQPSAALFDTLKSMLAWQAQKWRVDPTGESLHAASGLMLNVIGGHRDAGISPKATSSTECPGNTAYSFLPEVRRDVLLRTSACVVDIGERNRCAPAEGGSLPYAMQMASASCPAGVLVPAADWVSPQLEVQANPGPRRNTTVAIGGLAMTITQAGIGEAALPCIARRGIVNSANFDARPVVAGSQISIFGENFGASAKVAANGKFLPVEYAGPTQINLSLPSNIKIGTNHLTVMVDGTAGPEVNFWVTEAMPAIYVAVNADDNTLNTPATPVKPGRPLTVYLTGIGATAYPWSATVGGKPAPNLFLGLAPLFLGVYQANIAVPTDLIAGDYPLAFTVNGVTSRDAVVSLGLP